MAIQVQTPQGIVEFPDGTSPEVMKTALRRLYAQVQIAQQPQMSVNPTEGMSRTQQFLAGAGKAMTDIGRGIGQVAGLVSQEDIAAARERDRALMETGAGTAGNIVGGVATMLPTMLVPGANTIAGASLIGAGVGALAPTVEEESRIGNAVLGGAAGAAGQAAASGLSRVLAPRTAPAVKELMEEGVTPTPGQIMGGAAQRAESALESVPFLGQGIRQAKTRGIEQFNRAAINRALEPIGAKVDDIGHKGIEQALGAIDNAYNTAIQQLKRVDIDAGFNAELNKVRQMAASLTPDRQNQLESIIKTRILDKITPAGTLSGDSFKQVTSELKTLARGYRKSMDMDQQQVGNALNAIVASMNDLAARNSPDAAKALKAADTAYAMFMRVERAAGMQGSPDGIFTPAQLGNAVRTLDTSVRRRAVARGDALMQDLTTAGRSVLGETLPNSGTADRALTSLLTLGGGYLFDPALAGSIIAGRAAYTPIAQRGITAALTQRPEVVRAAGGLVERAAPLAGLAGIQGVIGGQ